jgi:AAA15 family ATPase/GTPase
MRIDELTIQNFKCFENETFHFNPHFNVVIGKNGSGKSSLLDAVAMATSSYISGLISPGYFKWIQSIEIRTILISGPSKPQISCFKEGIGYYSQEIKINLKGRALWGI